MSEYRYERKFSTYLLDKRELEQAILLHPYGFKEIYYERQINSVYYDTLDFKSYFDNVYGNTNRVKARIRWYGELSNKVEHPVLELKVKQGLMGKKISKSLEDTTLDNLITSDLNSFLDKEELEHLKLSTLKAAVLISYTRRYFESFDKNLRITIDSDIKFYKAETNVNLQLPVKYKDFIIEAKYNPDFDSYIDLFTSKLPIRLTKFSKYVNAMDAVHF